MSLAWVAAAVNAGAAERETVAFFETEELVVDPEIKRSGYDDAGLVAIVAVIAALGARFNGSHKISDKHGFQYRQDTAAGLVDRSQTGWRRFGGLP
jgi:hypothetical protein